MKLLVVALCLGAALAAPVPDADADWSSERMDFDSFYPFWTLRRDDRDADLDREKRDADWSPEKFDDDDVEYSKFRSYNYPYRYNFPYSYMNRRYDRDVEDVERVERDADPQLLLLDNMNTLPLYRSSSILPMRSINPINPLGGGFYNRVFRSADAEKKGSMAAVLHPKGKKEEHLHGEQRKVEEKVRNKRDADPKEFNPTQHKQQSGKHLLPGKKLEHELRPQREADSMKKGHEHKSSIKPVEKKVESKIRKMREAEKDKQKDTKTKPKEQKPLHPVPSTTHPRKERQAVSPVQNPSTVEGSTGMHSTGMHSPSMTHQQRPGISRTGMHQV
jgi:hypothetical protein